MGTPTMLSSRPRLQARPKLRKATSAIPLVTQCGGDLYGYVNRRTSVVPPASCCPAPWGKVAGSSAVRETVPPSARALYKTARAQSQCFNLDGGDGLGHEDVRGRTRRKGRGGRGKGCRRTDGGRAQGTLAHDILQRHGARCLGCPGSR